MVWAQRRVGANGGDGQQFSSVVEKLSRSCREVVEKLKQKIADARLRKIPELEQLAESKDDDSKASAVYTRPVYVLVNRKTASSGESTTQVLRSLPNVEVVGENTAGYIHFGNKGQFQLPYSKIVISIGTHFVSFKDGQFLEKVGMTPDQRVPAGTDALDWLIKNKY